MAAAEHKHHLDVETDHDYDGIREFDNPLPAWWLWTFAITTVFGIVYWMWYHSLPAEGSFEVHFAELAEFQQAIAANAVSEEELVAIAKDPAAIEAGKATFMAQCKSCHGEKGEGGIGANLTDGYWIHGRGPKEIWTTITFGVTTKGMPSWGPVLGDAKIRELYAFVNTLRDTNVAGKAPQGVDAAGVAAP